jgi:hypothetical protein
MRNSEDFLHTLGTLQVQPNDVLVSFDDISLHKGIRWDSLNLLSQQFDEGNIRLFHHVLTSCFFCFNGQFCKQLDRVAMGSPLSPFIADFFVEHFEEVMLSRAAFKPIGSIMWMIHLYSGLMDPKS